MVKSVCQWQFCFALLPVIFKTTKQINNIFKAKSVRENLQKVKFCQNRYAFVIGIFDLKVPWSTIMNFFVFSGKNRKRERERNCKQNAKNKQVKNNRK